MVQFTCPYCRREFPYNDGAIDKEIDEIGQRQAQINKRLSEIKMMGKQYKDEETWKERGRLIKELNKNTAKLTELKSIRKVAKEHQHKEEYLIFKELVRDKYGDAAYHKLIEQVEEEIKAYDIAQTMRREYTRSNAKSDVININKLR